MSNLDEMELNSDSQTNQKKKIAVLIDAENLRKAMTTNLKPDYKSIFSCLKKIYNNDDVDLVYFVGYLKKYNIKSHFETNFFYTIKSHLENIASIGFKIKKKETHFVTEEQKLNCQSCNYLNIKKTRKPKANVDTDTIHFIYQNWENCDEFSLLSNDGDFFSTVETLIKNAKFRNYISVNSKCSKIYDTLALSQRINLSQEIDKLNIIF